MIEVSISLFVVSICIVCSFNIVKNLINSNQDRLMREQVNNSLYAICSEVKYNLLYKEIKNEITNKKLIISYDKNLLSTLENKSLLSLDRSIKENKKVEIELLEDKEDYMIIKVKIIYKGIEEEQNLLKAEWMDYV
ncbi:hypothetical protein NNC19_16645 [Clostridium sp. SHJSY1]|uniref:hypothetical protein n=1 Tax=Clostridium sp. SHJSY1 TaxID=2942483 RepID=UPI00287629F7|nr:hypothetical protein [Clostridium sp. SHJSY1]MDS0527321.1 hypothetical protein [Clostridium sp. SHJSY1]